MKRIQGIYGILNAITDDLYIGSAEDIVFRIGRHFRDLKNNVHHSPKLQRAYKKYGVHHFKIVVLEKVKFKEDLIDREQFWIDYYESYSDYNVRSEADSCLGMTFGHYSKERRAKIGAAIRIAHQRPEVKAKMRTPRSKEFRETMREVAKNRKFSQATRDKLSRMRRGVPIHGGKRSEEVKEKIRKTVLKYYKSQKYQDRKTAELESKVR